MVWQKSIKLATNIYKLTSEFPSTEQYALSGQMRRAAVSIPSNIAEGYRRQGLGKYLHFLSIANASAAELETQIVFSEKLYPKFNYAAANRLLNEVLRMLCVLISKLEAKR